MVPVLTKIKGKVKFQAISAYELGQNNFDSRGNFGDSGNKGTSSNTRPWGQSKDVKAYLKGHVKSTSFDKNMKRERSGSERNYESSNMAKKRTSADEFNKRRRNNSCISCGEVGHRFNDCPNTKKESVVDVEVPTSRTPISDLPFAIDESCVINLKTGYVINSIKYHSIDSLVIRGEVVPISPVGSAIG